MAHFLLVKNENGTCSKKNCNTLKYGSYFLFEHFQLFKKKTFPFSHIFLVFLVEVTKLLFIELRKWQAINYPVDPVMIIIIQNIFSKWTTMGSNLRYRCNYLNFSNRDKVFILMYKILKYTFVSKRSTKYQQCVIYGVKIIVQQ